MRTRGLVGIYLKELRAFPLLTRKGEIRIAKKIKTGKQEILSAALNCPKVIQEIINLGKDLRSGRSKGFIEPARKSLGLLSPIGQ